MGSCQFSGFQIIHAVGRLRLGLGLGLGSGPCVVGRLGSGMGVSASFQIIPGPVGRLGLGLGSEPHVVGRLGSGPGVGAGGCLLGSCLQGELSQGAYLLESFQARDKQTND